METLGTLRGQHQEKLMQIFVNKLGFMFSTTEINQSSMWVKQVMETLPYLRD